MKNSLRVAAFCAGIVAGGAWLTSSDIRCFVAVVRCFMRQYMEVDRRGCGVVYGVGFTL